MTNNRLVKRQICEVSIKGCIQVRSSLFAYFDRDNRGNYIWSSFTDLDKETVAEKALTQPFFTERTGFSMANFHDQLIFLIGGINDSF